MFYVIKYNLFILLIGQNYISEYILFMILIIVSYVKLVLSYKTKKRYIVENKFFILYVFISIFINDSLILCTLIVVLVFDRGNILYQDKEHIQTKS